MNRIILKPDKTGMLVASQISEEEVKRLLESGEVQLYSPSPLVYKMTSKTDIPHTYSEDTDPLELPSKTYETREMRAQPADRPRKLSPAEQRRRKYQTKELSASDPFEVLED